MLCVLVTGKKLSGKVINGSSCHSFTKKTDESYMLPEPIRLHWGEKGMMGCVNETITVIAFPGLNATMQ